MLMLMLQITMAHEMPTNAKQANLGMSSREGLRVRLIFYLRERRADTGCAEVGVRAPLGSQIPRPNFVHAAPGARRT